MDIKQELLQPEDIYRIDNLTAISRPEERYSLREHRIQPVLDDTPLPPLSCTPELLSELILGHLVSEGFVENKGALTALTLGEDNAVARCTTGQPGAPRRTADTVPAIREYRGAPHWLHYFALEPRPMPDTLQRGMLMRQGEILYRCFDLCTASAAEKAIGCGLRDGVPLEDTILYCDGALTEALVSKVILAGIPVLCGSGIPTDRAVALARKHHISLVGTVRKDGIDLFSDRYLW